MNILLGNKESNLLLNVDIILLAKAYAIAKLTECHIYFDIHVFEFIHAMNKRKKPQSNLDISELGGIVSTNICNL